MCARTIAPSWGRNGFSCTVKKNCLTRMGTSVELRTRLRYRGGYMSVLTRRQSGRVGLLVLAAILLAAMLVLIPAIDASGETTVEAEAGVILLSTGPETGDNWIRYFESPLAGFDVETPDYEQYIDVHRCKVTTPTGDPGEASLLTIAESPSSTDVGLVSNGFGVRTKNNCATSNGQISTSQSLTFSLGGFFDSTHAIDRIEVDVEGKQNAQLAYELDNGAETGTKTINSASDNGADAGTGDNIVVVITGDTTERFTSVSFSPTGNSKALVSIEGGGDGAALVEDGEERLYPGVTQTLFHIVTSQTFDGDLLCDEPRSPTAIAADGPAVDGSVERLDDLKGEGDCTTDAVPYTFQIQDDSVYFDYLDSGEGAQFIVRIDWKPGDPLVDPISPPIRQIDFTNDGVDNYVDGVACTSVSGGVYVHPTDGAGNDIPWCLIDHDINLTPDGWQQIQWWHGQGDPRWK